MPDITYAIRTYGREQLGFTLSCIYALGEPVQIVLAVDAKHKITGNQGMLIAAMEQDGFDFKLKFAQGSGAGPNLLNLISAVFEARKNEFVCFVDDDLIFHRNHIAQLVEGAREKRCATFVPRDIDTKFAAYAKEYAGRYPMIDMYFTMFRTEDFLAIPLCAWSPLERYGGMTDLVYFSGTCRLHGFTPNVLLDDSRPLHIFDLKERRKYWARIKIKFWEARIEEAYHANSMHDLLSYCDEHSSLLAKETS